MVCFWIRGILITQLVHSLNGSGRTQLAQLIYVPVALSRFVDVCFDDFGTVKSQVSLSSCKYFDIN